MVDRLALVTGAPGWIGTRLVQALKMGMSEVPAVAGQNRPGQIRCLIHPRVSREALRAIPPGIEVVEDDLSDPRALATFFERAEGAILFHCAGVIHPSRRVRELFDVNVSGTRRLLEEAERAGVRRVVVVSSNSPLGNNPHPLHQFDEASPYHPYMAYGRSKMLMEQVVHEVQARGRMETVIIRPPWFYGPGQPPRQTRFFTMIRDGKMPLLGSGDQRRSMAYIDNLCQGLLLAGQIPSAAGQTYWIADRRPYPMREIIDTVERLLEREFGMTVAHRRIRLPSIVGDVAGIADAVIQGFGRYLQEIHVLSEMNKTIACSIAKAERELGYAPTVELEEGMRRSLAWCWERGLLK